MDDTTTLKAPVAQGAAPNKPRRRFQIPRSPSPPIIAPVAKTSPFASRDFLRALRRHQWLFHQAEAARIARVQFNIRCEKAVMVIARTGADTNVACRSVGLGESTKARKVVKALCDERKIASGDVGHRDAVPESEGSHSA